MAFKANESHFFMPFADSVGVAVSLHCSEGGNAFSVCGAKLHGLP